MKTSTGLDFIMKWLVERTGEEDSMFEMDFIPAEENVKIDQSLVCASHE